MVFRPKVTKPLLVRCPWALMTFFTLSPGKEWVGLRVLLCSGAEGRRAEYYRAEKVELTPTRPRVRTMFARVV